MVALPRRAGVWGFTPTDEEDVVQDGMDDEMVLDRLVDIQAVRSEAGVAHSMQDQLFRDVLRTVAEDRPVGADVRAMCALALTVDAIEFPRWMA